MGTTSSKSPAMLKLKKLREKRNRLIREYIAQEEKLEKLQKQKKDLRSKPNKIYEILTKYIARNKELDEKSVKDFSDKQKEAYKLQRQISYLMKELDYLKKDFVKIQTEYKVFKKLRINNHLHKSFNTISDGKKRKSIRRRRSKPLN